MKIHRILRATGLVCLGVVLNFGGLIAAFGIATGLFRVFGVPPDSWFGSDYVDRRGASVAAGIELFVLCLSGYAVGLRFAEHGKALSRLDSFWLCNPVSSSLGLAGPWLVARNLVIFEFTAAVVLLWPVAWLMVWHLALLGSEQARWGRALCTASLYSLLLGSVGIYRAYRMYGS